VSNKGNTQLVTPVIAVPTGGAILTFQNLFNMQATPTTGFDGMVLEIKINDGGFTDILAAGGSFVTGGYTHTISTDFGNQIGGRMAWSGLSGGTAATPAYITTTVNLPTSANGQNIQLKWRAATDDNTVAEGAAGVRIDNIVINPASCGMPFPTPTPIPTATPPGNPIGVALVEVYDLNQAAASKLANLSTRALVSTGDNIVIAGFLISGNGKGLDRIIVRGIGPSLAPGLFPPSAVLANPTLELRDMNGTLLVANNDWQDDPAQAAEITAAGLALSSNLESGIAATLPPGLYTGLLAGLNNGTGIGLVEVYDRGDGNGGPSPQAVNLSTRMRVETGDDVGIGGFIIAGTEPKRVLLRAIGPSLAGSGVPDPLADPILELHGPAGFATIINDNWRDTQEAEIIATGIAPTNDLESAIAVTLTPGVYTAIVRGHGP
jgi:hypothetical protein